MKVNTGVDQSHLASGSDRPEYNLGSEGGTEVRVANSGANATPDSARPAPSVQGLDSGPKLDAKGAYRPATYALSVSHNSNGGATDIIRQDR